MLRLKTNMKRFLILLVLFVAATPFSVYADETIAEISIDGSDVRAVKVEFLKDYPPSLEITLTRSKAEEISQVTQSNLMKNVRVRILDTVVGEPKVVEPLAGNVFKVRPNNPEDPVRLAKSLMQK